MHSKGDYTVSSAYKGLNQEGSLLSYLRWKLIWKQRGIRWEMPRITFEVLTRWSTESKCSTNKDRWKIVSATIWWSKWKERNSRCFGNTSNPLQRIKNELYPSVLLLGYKSEHIDDPVLIIEILCFLLEELGVGLLFLLLSGSSDVKHSFFV
nr:uncharacterized protein LOC104646472 [Solanum lycopersicum]